MSSFSAALKMLTVAVICKRRPQFIPYLQMSNNETGANNPVTGNQDIEVKKAISPSGKVVTPKVVTPKVVSKGKGTNDGRKRSNAEQEVRFWSPFGAAFKILPKVQGDRCHRSGS